MKNKIIKYLLFFFLAFCIITFFYIVFSPFVYQKISMNSLLYLIGKFFGLIGFLFLSILIISGDTARFFDRFFGMDKIIKFQRKFALVTIFIISLHPFFFILSNGKIFNYLIPDFSILPLAIGIVSFYSLIIVEVCSILYKRISYRAWQYIHILIYILFFFIVYHLINIGSDIENIFFRLIFGVLIVGLASGAVYRGYYKIKNRKKKFYVKEIIWDSPDVFSLIVKSEQNFSFKPGQFCFLRLNKKGLYARHPFTISSGPEDEYLSFTIKNSGRFTKSASQLKEGEEVIIDGPFGIFTIGNKEEKKDLVFIAGGVGITPFMSMIKYFLSKNEKPNVILLYGVRTEKDLIFRKQLDEIKESWFKKIYILSEEKNSQNFEFGFVDESFIKKYVKDIKNSLFYVCGPEIMKEKIIKILKNLGVKKKDIKIESFFW